MKLIDWILLIIVAALLALAFYLANRRSGSCHGQCGGRSCGEGETCEHCRK